METIYKTYYSSEIGIIEINCSEDSVISLKFVKEKGESTEINEILDKTYRQIDEYFSGKRKSFDLKLKLQGTEFQKKVWNELTKIPYGKTVTYKDIATRIGNEKAVRAVGNSNNKNKIPIIIPCHRVIGKNGKLVGYAGGLDKKQWLLNHEKKFI